MILTMKQTSLVVATFGVLSFILGIIAENKMPASGTAITGKGVVICKYPSASTVSVVLGYLSTALLAACTVAGYLSLFHAYQGKAVPKRALYRNKGFTVFFNIALFTAGLAAALLIWPTATEHNNQIHHVHHMVQDVLDEKKACPSAQTGVLGGGAFLSLDSCLFWLVALMLADNAREDYFEENEDKVSGSEPLKV